MRRCAPGVDYLALSLVGFNDLARVEQKIFAPARAKQLYSLGHVSTEIDRQGETGQSEDRHPRRPERRCPPGEAPQSTRA